MNIEQYRNFLVSDRHINEENRHADRCTYVWKKLYVPFYSVLDFWKYTDFSKIQKYDYVF